MKILNSIIVIVMLMLVSSCSNESSLIPGDGGDSSLESYDSALTNSFSGSTSGGSGSGQNGGEAGLVTAGEWNDIDNWDFWSNLLNSQDYSNERGNWNFHTNNRVSVVLTNNNRPVNNAKVELKKDGNIIWSSKSDNFGKAELWIGLFKEETSFNIHNFSLVVNGQPINKTIKLIEEGTNEIELNVYQALSNRVELSFIVDATGSMGDELEFLKEDLMDVIHQVKNINSSLNILTSTVFYRDEGDDYLVKHSGFTENISNTIDFINKQSAAGGGDFPEAVHIALDTGIDELQWSEESRLRIAFLLLDAPPHNNQQIIDDLHISIKKYSEKGIKIIPITASGIDKDTEFLMRFFSISTNGTYVFITNDSGIGNEHLEPSVGDFQVEKLNDLMVRLIVKYTEQ